MNKEQQTYATLEDLESLREEVKSLMRGFLDFVVAFGLELGVRPQEERAGVLSKLEHRSVNGASDDGDTWRKPNGMGHHA